MARKHRRSSSWEPVADWYIGWTGKRGGRHHRRTAIPAVMNLLDPRPGERIIDLGCGPGPLAPHVASTGALYTGVDLSPRLLGFAKRHHGGHGIFLLGDATRLHEVGVLQPSSFDAAVFLLSIQDIDPLEKAIASARWALDVGGRVVILMTHPCFRVPRGSGWGWDQARKLRYRRVESYLTRHTAPMQAYADGRGYTRSYHRPLSDYVRALANGGFAIDRLDELSGDADAIEKSSVTADARSDREIPLFLAIRAVTM